MSIGSLVSLVRGCPILFNFKDTFKFVQAPEWLREKSQALYTIEAQRSGQKQEIGSVAEAKSRGLHQHTMARAGRWT